MHSRNRTLIAATSSEPRRPQDVIFASIILITILAVLVPTMPRMPSHGLDPSWIYGLNQAIAQGLAFGRELIFTFGPYASVQTRTYHPATDSLMLWSSIYLSLSFAITIFLNFRGAKSHFGFALLFSLAAITYSRDSLHFFYPLSVGVYLFKKVVLNKHKQKHGVSWYITLIILLFPFGLLPLIKGSSWVACLAIIFICGIMLLKEQHWKSFLILCLIPTGATIIFWVIAGQPLSSLPSYFLSMIPLIRGYTEAMAKSGNLMEVYIYILGSLILTCSLFLIETTTINKLLAAIMFIIILFLAFKGGFVRHDGHAVLPAVTILLISFLASTLHTNRLAFIAPITAIFVWYYIYANYQNISFRNILHNANITYVESWQGLKIRILDNNYLQYKFEHQVSELSKRKKLPLMEGTADIYSYEQSNLISAGINWNPRPIFQSYAAYTRTLLERNKEHLLGKNAPQNIIFDVQTIDGRLPSLDDGASWPILLSDYRPVQILNGYLLLQHQALSSNPPSKLTRISRETHSLGDEIILPRTDGLVFLKINIHKTTPGVIWSTFFKPSPLEISIKMQNGITRPFHFISSMASAGFLINPLIETTEEYGLLYAGISYLNHKKVKSIKIDVNGLPALWDAALNIEFWRLDIDENPHLLQIHGLPRPQEINSESISLDSPSCEGRIDVVNRSSRPSLTFNTKFKLHVSGWLAKSTLDAELSDNVYLVLQSSSNKKHFIVKTNRISRLDVGRHFNNHKLDASGFDVTADISMLKGDYTLALGYKENTKLYICPNFQIYGSVNSG